MSRVDGLSYGGDSLARRFGTFAPSYGEEESRADRFVRESLERLDQAQGGKLTVGKALRKAWKRWGKEGESMKAYARRVCEEGGAAAYEAHEWLRRKK